MSEHRFYPLVNPYASTASTTHVYPQIITLNPNAAWADNSMTISISEYNSLLSQFMDRGDEITRLQARIAELEAHDDEPLSLDMPPRSSTSGIATVIDRGYALPDLTLSEDYEEREQRGDVLRNVLHYLTARSEVQSLTPAETGLLAEVQKVTEGKE